MKAGVSKIETSCKFSGNKAESSLRRFTSQ